MLHWFKIGVSVLIVSALASCNPEEDPAPAPTPVDPCEVIPGTNLYFGDYIYQFDEKGWPYYITSNDTVNGQGSNYRLYRYGGGIMTYSELSLNNGAFWSWDSLNCSGSNCTHYSAQSDSTCNSAAAACTSDMTLNFGNWVLTDGNTTYHYNDLLVLDSVTYSDAEYHFTYFQGRISKIYELDQSRDTMAVQTFTFNYDDQWREYYRLDYNTQQVEQLIYNYDTEGNLSMISVGYGPQPITLSDYVVTMEGCGEAPRNLDPLNLYRLPHMHMRYIGLPWQK